MLSATDAANFCRQHTFLIWDLYALALLEWTYTALSLALNLSIFTQPLEWIGYEEAAQRTRIGAQILGWLTGISYWLLVRSIRRSQIYGLIPSEHLYYSWLSAIAMFGFMLETIAYDQNSYPLKISGLVLGYLGSIIMMLIWCVTHRMQVRPPPGYDETHEGIRTTLWIERSGLKLIAPYLNANEFFIPSSGV